MRSVCLLLVRAAARRDLMYREGVIAGG